MIFIIEVGRNSIVVRDVDLNSKEFKKVNSRYSVYDPVTHKYTMSAFYILDTDVYFPASINAEEIQKCFPDKEIVYNYKTTAKSEKIEISLKNQPRNDLQKKAIAFLLKMKTDTKQRSRFLSLATGSGKTYVTINFISQLKKKAVIVVDTLDLATQWKSQFLFHTNLSDSDICILSGNDIVMKEIKNPSAKIYIAIHRTLGNILSENVNGVNQLMNSLKIGIRVFDESHVEFKNICNINSLSNVEYTIYLTATPSRGKFTDDCLYGKVLRKIPYFDGKELSQKNYHTVILCNYNSEPSLDVKYSVKTKFGFNVARWGSYITDKMGGYSHFYTAIKDVFENLKLLSRKKKIAIMLPTNDLIKQLADDLSIEYPETEFGVFIGEVKESKRKEILQKPVIITNDKIFEKGLDISDLEILINCIPSGNMVKLEQSIGRLRYGENKSSIYIDLADFGFDDCVKYFKVRKRFYKKHAKKIIEFEKN